MKTTPSTPDISIWNLQMRDNWLVWNGCALPHLAETYGTPLYVVNRNLLEETYRNMTDVFEAEDIDIRLFFSFKTNPVPEVLKILAKLGAGGEVISDFEFWLARRVGLKGSQIIVNGCTKKANLLKQAVESKAALINVETVSQLRSLLDVANQRGQDANVGLRINPGLRRRRFDLTSSTGSASSHMGFLPGSPGLSESFSLLRDNPRLRFRALHFHIGSGIRSIQPYKQALLSLLKVWEEVLRHGFHPEILDMGGGFNIPTLKELNLWEALGSLGWGMTRRAAIGKRQNHLIRDIVRFYAETLRDFSQKNGISLPKLYVEPGRALTARSQLLLLTVQEVIDRGKRGSLFALCDGGAMSISSSLLSEYHTVFLTNRADREPERRYNVLGSMPTPLDLVATRCLLPELERGDVLAVMDVGGYFTSTGNTFAGPRPAIAMIDDGLAKLIRRRETFDDLILRDVEASHD